MWRDDALLLDMLNAATEAWALPRSWINRNSMPAGCTNTRSFARCLTVIGEAASKISREFRDEHPEIEWQDIVGMRHRLVHNYGAIRLDVVWGAVHAELPELITVLQPLIPPDDTEGT